MPTWTPELEQHLQQQARAAGFDLAGIASVESPPDTHPDPHPERFAHWITEGRAGEMDYLKRRDDSGTLLRSQVQTAVPWARSVVVCAFNYNADAPASLDPAPPGTGWIARYAWSGRPTGNPTGDATPPEAPDQPTLAPSDYHDELLHRLRLVEAALLECIPCETRCYVDTGPIVERDLAAKAGIGWIGKNTCVLNQQQGSWLLLGVILTSLPIANLQIPAADRCGSCTRCLDACPTSALVAPRQMDASLCISYLTIEKKREIPEPLRALMGRQVFGCDICQDVCPWNRRAPIAHTASMSPRPELINPALEWLASLDNPTFKRHFRGSPLERTGRKRLQRNVAIAMGNSADPKFLPRLQTWSASDDPVLAEAAAWAILQISRPINPPGGC